jgi:hypothetical protein
VPNKPGLLGTHKGLKMGRELFLFAPDLFQMAPDLFQMGRELFCARLNTQTYFAGQKENATFALYKIEDENHTKSKFDS